MARVAIIGGGASGLTASIYASKNHKVTIFERNNICGKKITITGNGKCNYWNEDQELKHYHSHTPEILKNFFDTAIQKETEIFFSNLGIFPKIKNGYYYPYSMQATSIRNALVKKALTNNVKILYNFFVEEIKKENDVFIINPKKEHLVFDKVVLACGSMAAKKTGSDGIGYELAKSFGHKIVKPEPTLVQLVSNTTFLKDWHGVRCESVVSLHIEDELFCQEKGEIQLTDYGVSGICIFNISRYVKENLRAKKKILLHINFLPEFHNASSKELANWLDKRAENLKDYSLEEMLEGILPYKLLFVVLKEAHRKKEEHWLLLKEEEKINLIQKIKDFTIPIIDTLDFEHAQACSGGVSLQEIDMDTMESKKIKNLYILGELLDVDGDCGGYNLGFAWMSGIKCGKNC